MLKRFLPWLGGGQLDARAVSRWATQHGWRFRRLDGDTGWALEGQLLESACRIEWGEPQRPYILERELRVKVDINVDATISTLIVTRELQESLESLAFADLTDSLQTAVTSVLPEEVRWTAMFNEHTVSGDGQFTTRFAVIGDNREKSTGWVSGPLEGALLQTAQRGLLQERPFLVMLMRGRLYARAQADDLDMERLQMLLAVVELAGARARQLFTL